MGKTNPVKEHKCSVADEDFKHVQQDVGREKTKTRKAKRRRCVYSTGWDSSASNSKNPDGDQASYPSSAVKSHQFRNGVKTKANTKVVSDCSIFDRNDMMEIVLVDVQSSVNASPRAENAPFVSLASEAYGVAIIGYPLEVGEIREESGACKVFGDLVWRTSKRSPVCYVTSSPRKAGKCVKDPMFPAAEKSFVKLHKKESNKSCVPVQLIFSKILAAVD